jgi:tryptophan synthase beta chain
LLQDAAGQVHPAHSISAGLDYPGVGPEHSYLKDTGRAEYVAITDDEALEGFDLLSKTEGIIPALETAHAVAWIAQSAGRWASDEPVLLCVSGRGDKDVGQLSAASPRVDAPQAVLDWSVGQISAAPSSKG